MKTTDGYKKPARYNGQAFYISCLADLSKPSGLAASRCQQLHWRVGCFALVCAKELFC